MNKMIFQIKMEEETGLYVAGAVGRRRPHDSSNSFSKLQVSIDIMEGLIGDLGTISPSSTKACPVLDNKYMIWLNQTFSTVNIQKTDDYNKNLLSERSAIKINPHEDEKFVYFYENSLSLEGIPSSIVMQFEDIISDVNKQVSFFMKQSCFNIEQFKLLFDSLKREFPPTYIGREPNSCEYKVEGKKYFIWIKNGDDVRDKTYYVNIQLEDNYYQSTYFNKLGLHVDHNAKIKGVMIDGQRRPASEETALLFSPNAVWQKILKGVMGKWMETKGIRKNGRALEIHTLALKICPEKVLAAFDEEVRGIVFLNDNMTPQAGSDAGGLTKHFVTLLAQNLLDGDNSRFIKIGDSGLPFVDIGSDKENQGKEVAKNLGRLFGKIWDPNHIRSVSMGRVVPDSTFLIIQDVLNFSGDYPDVEFISKISKNMTNVDQLVSYLDGNCSQKNIYSCVQIFDELCIDLSPKERQGGEELKRQVFLFLKNKADPYIIMANEIIKGLNPNIKTWMKVTPYDRVSKEFQGEILDRDDIISRIYLQNIYQDGMYTAVRKKIQYLKEHIADPTTTLDWLKKFVFCVTGQTTLIASSKINIQPVATRGYCIAHTCFNSLDVPNTHQTPPLHVLDQKQKFLLNLEATMQDISFDRI